MALPKINGYTELVKIAEAALNGDKEKARKYIEQYIVRFPSEYLVNPFTHLLNGEKDPAGFRKHMEIETIRKV